MTCQAQNGSLQPFSTLEHQVCSHVNRENRDEPLGIMRGMILGIPGV